MDSLRFHPLYQERPWGGRALADSLGRTLPPGVPIGESWDLVDRDEAQSVVADGPHAGQSLRQMLACKAPEILGTDRSHGAFPLLVKWLDCRERLSLQVHPPTRVAARLHGEPKTENWFVAAARPDAAVFIGLKPGVSQQDFLVAVKAGGVEKLLVRLPVRAGDSIFVPSGTVHAIDAGCLILEIQQNSDTTYRVHDWGRLGADGRPRALHLRESLASIDWTATPASIVRSHPGDVLVDAPEFRLRRLAAPDGSPVRLASGGPTVLCVVDGRVVMPDGRIAGRGHTLLVPAHSAASLGMDPGSVVLAADRFLRR